MPGRVVPEVGHVGGCGVRATLTGRGRRRRRRHESGRRRHEPVVKGAGHWGSARVRDRVRVLRDLTSRVLERMHLRRIRVHVGVRVGRPLSELRAELLPECIGGGRGARRRPNLNAPQARRELPVHRRRPSRSRSPVRDACLVCGHILAHAHPDADADPHVTRERRRLVDAERVLLEGSRLVACSLSFAS